jgi:hypothetical protein
MLQNDNEITAVSLWASLFPSILQLSDYYKMAVASNERSLGKMVKMVKTVTSSLKTIKHGVPQRSVLGLLLFLLFMNDLPLVIQNAEVLFADDTNILITDENMLSLYEKIKNVQNQLENWFHENRLIINTDKSKVLFLGGSRSIPSTRPLFCINNKDVVCSVDVKFLGICITEDLSQAW